MVDSTERVDETFIGIEGGLYSFPLGTNLTYTLDGALPATGAFHGILSDSGVVQTPTASVDNKKGWQGNRTVRRVSTDSDLTIAASLLQMNDVNEELYTGRKKNATTGAFHLDPAFFGAARIFVVIAIDTVKNTKIKRIYPSATLSERGEQSFVSTDMTLTPVTLSADTVEVAGERTAVMTWRGAYVPTPVTPGS